VSISLEERIRGLKLLKEEKRMIREIYQGSNNQMQQIRSFVENEINKYIDMDIDKIEKDNNKGCFIF
jgi:hypothetical protein